MSEDVPLHERLREHGFVERDQTVEIRDGEAAGQGGIARGKFAGDRRIGPMAETVACQYSSRDEAMPTKAATVADNAQPTPVTHVISGEPFDKAIGRRPSVT